MHKTDLTKFDPEKVGQLDAKMWHAYYNHQFIRLFFYLMLLVRSQMRLNWLLTLMLAYYSAWAATDYRLNKQRGVNSQRVLKNLTKFYGLISRNSVRPFDYEKAAELELAWWDVHRKTYVNTLELESAIAGAAAAIYTTDANALRDYAHYRAEAMILPQHAGDDVHHQTDWPKVSELTIKSWQSLHSAVQEK